MNKYINNENKLHLFSLFEGKARLIISKNKITYCIIAWRWHYVSKSFALNKLLLWFCFLMLLIIWRNIFQEGWIILGKGYFIFLYTFSDFRTLIIDEISMVDGNLFQKVEEVARIVRKDPRPFGGIQLILCGFVNSS